MLAFSASLQNDASRPGSLAAPKQLFGESSRFAVAPVNTRFGELQWFVWDAEILDKDGRATIIRQEDTLELAIEGF
jgi:hypothetical protein